MKLISQKKATFRIQPFLKNYLEDYARCLKLPLSYRDLLNYTQSFPLLDKDHRDTLWESLIYDNQSSAWLNKELTEIYAMLKTDGDLSYVDHLSVERIDYCTFGNSKPFRIRIVNHYNDNYDYFYIKKADASRVYGLELEDLLSPNRISYYVSDETLIEEHIAGIPGDEFISNYMMREESNQVRIAKEFVKFSERCFVRLLGDMRSYNYVVDITPDFDNEQYRVRAIDFDQQSYEGKRMVYMPQFFKENKNVVELCMNLLNPDTVKQYQFEERTLMHRRYDSDSRRVHDLLNTMRKDAISEPQKVEQLKAELTELHKNDLFKTCRTMGDIVQTHIETIVGKLPDEDILSDRNALGRF